jgi:DNA-binding SARP family transcriptional activator
VHGQTASSLQIRCFGQFEVLRDGVSVQRWRRERARLLLKYLVVQARPVPRGIILSWLWPGVPTGVSGGHLRVVLHALRQAIGTWGGNDYVRLDGDHVSLDHDAPLWIDTNAFMAHVYAAETFVRQGLVTKAIDEGVQAEGIYRGDYLVEDTLEPWALLRREELKDRYQVMLTRLADVCLQMGDYVGTIERCHKLLAQDNCREDVYQRLMYCHAVLGYRSRAVRWYEMCQIALRTEFGHEADAETTDLFHRIVAGVDLGPGHIPFGQEHRLLVDGRDA